MSNTKEELIRIGYQILKDLNVHGYQRLLRIEY
jgi:hypothetical protein